MGALTVAAARARLAPAFFGRLEGAPPTQLQCPAPPLETGRSWMERGAAEPCSRSRDLAQFAAPRTACAEPYRPDAGRGGAGVVCDRFTDATGAGPTRGAGAEWDGLLIDASGPWPCTVICSPD